MDTPHDTSTFEDGAVREFREAVAGAAPEELEVTPTPGGFDVVYRNELTQHGILLRIDSTYRSVVLCDPVARTFSMADVGVVRSSSLGGLRRSTEVFKGRMYMTRTVDLIGKREDGSLGKVDTQTQNTRVLHKAIREPAAALGWTEGQPTSAKVGKIVAIATGAALTVAGVVVAILALTGSLS